MKMNKKKFFYLAVFFSIFLTFSLFVVKQTKASSSSIKATVKVSTSAQLPAFLKIFDANDNGKVESDELYSALSMWVSKWREFLVAMTSKVGYRDISGCDFNNDDVCNVRDFSILLFYIER